MTAKNLSHYKNKLQDISRELYLENNWKMPHGLVRGATGDPRNFSLAEWQQCKRMGKNARDLKATMQDCWAVSDNSATFQQALKEQGLVLAKGDRRGHVAVTHEGEVLSIARYVGKKAKEIHARLGEPENLPSVDDAKIQIAKDMAAAFKQHTGEAKTQRHNNTRIIEKQRKAMVSNHREERKKLKAGQQKRWDAETRQRSARLNTGLKGIWQRVTGQRKHIQQRNENEAYKALKRDRMQYNAIICEQLKDRRALQIRIKKAREQSLEVLHDIRSDQQRYRKIQNNSKTPLQKSFAKTNRKPTAPSLYDRLERLRKQKSLPTRSIGKGPEIER